VDHHRRQPRRDRPRQRAAWCRPGSGASTGPDRTPSPVAQVEQALIATAVARAGGQICSIDRYSTRPDPPAVRYGATIGFHDGWKLFLSCYGTTGPGQPRPDHPYHPYHHPSSHI
jgi:hypothetical protein